MKNRFQSALDIIKVQLMETSQNIKAFETLQELVDLVAVMDEIEDGTLETYTLEEAFEEVFDQDSSDNMCLRYEKIEEE